MPRLSLYTALMLAVLSSSLAGWGTARPSASFVQSSDAPRPIAPPPGYMEAAEKSLAAPFQGLTTDGKAVPGLFTIQRTGISI
jgi:hypothetical protein